VNDVLFDGSELYNISGYAMQLYLGDMQGHSVFVEALHDRFPKAIKGCVRGGALLARHPPREPHPSPKVEPDDTISPSAH